MNFIECIRSGALSLVMLLSMSAIVACGGGGTSGTGLGDTTSGIEIVDPSLCGGSGCEANSYCNYPEGACGLNGQGGSCQIRPEICTLLFDPVCGCDANTYASECAANASGISIQYRGECIK